MASSPRDPEIVRVSQKGQATIPKPLREKFDIDTPGEVFVYEADGRIVIEPIPSLEELGGIHGDEERDPGDVLDRVHELKDEDEIQRTDRLGRFRPTTDEDG